MKIAVHIYLPGYCVGASFETQAIGAITIKDEIQVQHTTWQA